MQRLFVWHNGNENLVNVLEAFGIEHGEALPDDCESIHHLVYLGGKTGLTDHLLRSHQVWNRQAVRPFHIDRQWMLERWQTYGMATEIDRQLKPMDEVLSCRLLVVHLKVVWQSRGWVEWPYEPRSRLQRLMRREAIKAVYALGWEIAEVRLALQGKDRYVIQSVSVTPFWQVSEVKALAEALQNSLPDPTDETPALRRKMGADCELLLYSAKTGKVVSADRFLSKGGSIGCDGVLLRGNRIIYPLMEFRPLPAESPEKLLQNLMRVMKKAKLIIDEKYMWISGGMPFKGLPLGGHLHFSGVVFHSEMIRALDNYLALPVMFMEHETDKDRRPRYGYPGDFRLKSYGFEYRSLPSWLHDPDSALAICTLAWLVVSNWRTLNDRPLSDLHILRGFMVGNRSVCREAAMHIWHQIKDLPEYNRYQTVLNRIEQAIRDDHHWTKGQDIRIAWKITDGDALGHNMI